jgi:dienelactone hydrolase
MVNPRARMPAIIVTVAALFLSACGSSGSDDSAAPTSAPLTSAPSSTSAPDARARAIDVAVGDLELPGTLVLPPGDGPFPAIVLLAGSGPNDRDETVGPNHPLRDLADGLASEGVATLRYDKRTKVHAQDIDLNTFMPADEYVTDAVAAVDLLKGRDEIDPNHVVVLGHSQGGTMTPQIAKSAPALAGVILMAAGAEPFGAAVIRQSEYLASLQPSLSPAAREQLDQLRAQAKLIDDPNLPLDTPTSSLFGGIGAQYWRELTHDNPAATAAALDIPILLLQGGRDYQVTVDDDLARWRHALAGHDNVTERRYPNANHLFIDGSGPPNPDEYNVAGSVNPHVATDIAEWMHPLP